MDTVISELTPTRADSERFGRRSAFADGGKVDATCVCGHVVRLSPMHDAKTAPSGAVILERSGRASATIANAWAMPAGPLEHGGTCAQVSVGPCDSCYAAAIEGARPAFAEMVSANWDAVRHLLGCVGPIGTGEMLAEVVCVSADRQRAAGIAVPLWRWQADGDIPSAAYATALRHAVDLTPDVQHWVYTRSTAYVRYLVGNGLPSNLRLLISADRVNLPRAVRAAVRYRLPLAMLADDSTEAARLWDRVATLDPHGVIPRPIVCPAGSGSRYGRDGHGPAHIVGTDGRRRSLERGALARGACDACRVCLPDGLNRSVTFLVHGGRRRASIVEQRVSISARRGS